MDSPGLNWMSVDPSTGDLLPVNCEFNRFYQIPDTAFSGPGWPHLEISPKKRELGHVVVVTPYSKKHRRHIARCEKLVRQAWEYSTGPFEKLTHVCLLDKEGRGPAWGRNKIIETHTDADWFFFLDADDLIKPFAFEAMNWMEQETDSVWGFIEWRSKSEKGNSPYEMRVNPFNFQEQTWLRLLETGHDGAAGLNNACFVRASLARKFPAFETAHTLEDIECFICWWAHGTAQKLPFPLTTVDSVVPSNLYTEKNRSDSKRFMAWISVFWKRNGRQALRPEIIEFRREMAKEGALRDFYEL